MEQVCAPSWRSWLVKSGHEGKGTSPNALRELEAWDFPGGPEVKILHFHYRGQHIRPLVQELRSHKLRGVAKKKKKNKCI